MALLTGSYNLVMYLLFYRTTFKLLSRARPINKYRIPVLRAERIINEQEKGSVETMQAEAMDEETTFEFQVALENTKESIVYACMDEVDGFFRRRKEANRSKKNYCKAKRCCIINIRPLKLSGYRFIKWEQETHPSHIGGERKNVNCHSF
jgi:hypothetical protein